MGVTGRTFGVAATVLLILCGALGAETYVVDQRHAKASDENPGTAEAPLKTIGRAVSAAKAGDTVLVKSGSYAEAVDITKSGTEGKAIWLRAAPGEEVVVLGGLEISEAAHVRVEGLKFTWSEGVKSRKNFIGISKSRHVEVTNCEAFDKAEKEDWWGLGCGVGGSQHVTVRDCRFHHVDFGVSLGGSQDCVVTGVDIGPWDHEDGLRLTQCERVLVENCHIHSEETCGPKAAHQRKGHIDGIQFVFWSHDITIRNCRVYGSMQGICGFTDDFGKRWDTPRRNIRIEGNVVETYNKYQAITFYRVENPVIINNTVPLGRIEIGSVTGDRGVAKNNIAAIGSISDKVAECDYNLWIEEVKSGTKVGAHDLVKVDPLFADAGARDYRLKPESPAVDSADSGVGRGKDRNGNEAHDATGAANKGTGPKPYLDRGALEYVPAKE